MLRIQYLDKDRFMQQVAASRGSVLLHLANGETGAHVNSSHVCSCTWPMARPAT